MNKNNTMRGPEIATEIYLIILFLIFPLWFGLGGYTDLTDVKYTFFKWSAVIYMAVMVLTLVELSVVGHFREVVSRVKRVSYTQICFLAFMLFCCISALLSDYQSLVWTGAGRYEGLGTILLYSGLFLLIARFGKFKKYHLYLLGFVVLLNAIIGTLQYAGMNPFSLYPEGYTFHDAYKLYSSSFLGTLGNIDLLSAFLSLVVPLFYAYYILKDKSGIFLIPFAAGIFILLLSGVSAGVIGVGAGILITFPFIANTKRTFAKAMLSLGAAAFCAAVVQCISYTYDDRITRLYLRFGFISAVLLFTACILIAAAIYLLRVSTRKSWDSRKAKKILAVSIASLAVLVVAIVWAYPFPSGTLAEAHQLLHGNLNTEAGSSRIRIWRESLKLVPEHFWFGGGPDTLAERMTFSFKRYSETLGITIESFIDNAHNDYLNILVNTGIFSLLAYLAALVCSISRAARQFDKNKTALFIMTALVCYLIQIFFSFSICIISPFFWVFFGLLESALLKNNDKDVVKCVRAKK